MHSQPLLDQRQLRSKARALLAVCGEGAVLVRASATHRHSASRLCLRFLQSGRAISLQCNCRGDLALRHKECAIKWAQVSSSRM